MRHCLVVAFAVLASLSAGAHVLAQPPAGSAGAGNSAISGVPPGPGSVGGINNAVSDPSGIGNAARVPSPAVGSVTGPATTLQGPVVSGFRSRPERLSRVDGRKLSHAQQEIAVKENDRLLNQKLHSICRGC